MPRKIDPLTRPATALLRALDKIPPDQRGAALSVAQFVIEQERKAAAPKRETKKAKPKDNGAAVEHAAVDAERR